MLISQQHGCIFVHVAKTGGTSIRTLLTANRWRDPWFLPSWVAHRASAFTGHQIAAKIPRHASIIAAQEMLPPDRFASLFKFGFVRNPWDRLVSAYGHFQRERTDVLTAHTIRSFDDFCQHIMESDPSQVIRGALIRAIQRPQIASFVGMDGELLADYVGRYESLVEDFRAVAERLSLSKSQLPHKRHSAETKDYRTSYSDVLAERVRVHYGNDVDAFGYQFDDSNAASSPAKKVANRWTYGLASFEVARDAPANWVHPISERRG